MVKTLLSAVLCFSTFLCSAQKQLLTYQDLQYLMQNGKQEVKGFLQQKDYHLVSDAENETRYMALMADIDYIDILISHTNKHHLITITTTDLPQVQMMQKALEPYHFKDSKRGKVYKIKDDAIANLYWKEGETPNLPTKFYTIQLEN